MSAPFFVFGRLRTPPLLDDAQRDLSAVVQADSHPDHADHKSGGEANASADVPARIAADGRADECPQFSHTTKTNSSAVRYPILPEAGGRSADSPPGW